MKFCKDCKYSDGYNVTSYVRCKRPTGEINPVSGEPVLLDRLCEYERSPQGYPFLVLFSRKKCGPKGIFWEKAERINDQLKG